MKKNRKMAGGKMQTSRDLDLDLTRKTAGVLY